jgi:hypothetical protein
MVDDRFAQNWPRRRAAAIAEKWRLVRLGRTDGLVEEREPHLDDLLEDPIARALMASDGVERREVERLLAHKRQSWYDSDAG